MTSLIKRHKFRRKVRMSGQPSSFARQDPAPSHGLAYLLQRSRQHQTMSQMSETGRGDGSLNIEKMQELALDEAPEPPLGPPSPYATPNIPIWHLEQPVLRDSLVTETSKVQADTMFECMPFLAGTGDHLRAPFTLGSQGIPRLERQLHIEYLHQSLGSLSEAFMMADASRPWLIYWALLGLSLLGEDVSPYRER